MNKNRTPKSLKETKRIENARAIGTGCLIHTGNENTPMVGHLKIAALERNINLLCQSWTKGHLVERLNVNPPAVETQ
jgi:hypothetical protein